jgi:predicted enzyme related to lactoylglutathione lyase
MTTATSSVPILRRTTFVVADAEAAAGFYEHVFGWTRFYDQSLVARAGLPPAGPADAPVKLVLLKAQDPHIGMLGFLQYLEPPFDTGTLVNRTRVRLGEAMLVIQTADVDGIHARAVARGATIVVAPLDWQVPAHDGKGVIRLRSLSMFDPQGIYSEVNHMSV